MVVNNRQLKGLGREEGKEAHVSVMWEAAQALRMCLAQGAGSSVSAACEESGVLIWKVLQSSQGGLG